MTPSPSPGPERRSGPAPSPTRRWFLWHSWLAMPVWAFLFFICLTGSVAVMSHEIMWLANPAMRAGGEGSNVPVRAMVAAAEAAAPGGRVSSLAWLGAHMAVEAVVSMPDGSTRRAWINPTDGRVQALSSGASFQGFFRALHGWLLTYPFGWYAVSLMGLPLLGSLITGIVVYKRFWRAYRRPSLRLNRGPRVMWGDLHRLAGAWSLWFLALMAVTGLWFLINTLSWRLGVPLAAATAPALVAESDVPVAATAPRSDPDAILRAAQAAVPGMRLRRLILPSGAYVPARVFGSGGQAPLLPDTIQVNPWTYQVMAVSGGFDRPVGQMVGIIMRALHTGDFGGLPVKLVWLAFGLLLSLLVFSGMMVWTRRTWQATAQWRRDRAEARGVSGSGSHG